jgi:hypothetical protein
MALIIAARELGARFSERTWKGPGFDFFLQPPSSSRQNDADDIFGGRWALEVSGILNGDATDVASRLRQKRQQVLQASQWQRTLVVIVEFSEPSTVLELQ